MSIKNTRIFLSFFLIFSNHLIPPAFPSDFFHDPDSKRYISLSDTQEALQEFFPYVQELTLEEVKQLLLVKPTVEIASKKDDYTHPPLPEEVTKIDKATPQGLTRFFSPRYLKFHWSTTEIEQAKFPELTIETLSLHLNNFFSNFPGMTTKELNDHNFFIEYQTGDPEVHKQTYYSGYLVIKNLQFGQKTCGDTETLISWTDKMNPYTFLWLAQATWSVQLFQKGTPQKDRRNKTRITYSGENKKWGRYIKFDAIRTPKEEKASSSKGSDPEKEPTPTQSLSEKGKEPLSDPVEKEKTEEDSNECRIEELTDETLD